MLVRDIHVLVVDDSKVIRRLVTDILNKIGFYLVSTADCGEDALKVLENEDIGLIISDWNMPGMSGLDLLQAVRAHTEWSDIPFIMLTAESMRENILTAVKCEVNMYVTKPFTGDLLAQKIEKVLELDARRKGMNGEGCAVPA